MAEDKIDLLHNKGLTTDDLKHLRMGFLDALHNRNLPPKGLDESQLKRWREGLADGYKYSRRYERTHMEFLGLDDPNALNALMNYNSKRDGLKILKLLFKGQRS